MPGNRLYLVAKSRDLAPLQPDREPKNRDFKPTRNAPFRAALGRRCAGLSVFDGTRGASVECVEGVSMQDINEVLRRKKAKLEVLGKQISQLQEAAEEIRSIAHLLQDEDEERGHSAGR